MNKRIIYKTIALLLAGGMLGFSSCRPATESNGNRPAGKHTAADTQKSPTAADTLLTATLYETKESHIDNDNSLPACTVKIDLEYPSGGYMGKMSLQQLQRLFIESLPEGMNDGSTPQAAVRHFIENYIGTYQSEMSEMIKEVKKKDHAWMNYETIVTSKSLYNRHGFWGYSVLYYEFTGGAHGISATTYNVVDLQSGKPVVLSDLFAEADYQAVNDLLRRQLAADAGISTERLKDDYDVDNIVVNESFMPGDSTLTWLYNPYDIAPYAFGTICISLPYKAIVGYLKPDAPLRRIIP